MGLHRLSVGEIRNCIRDSGGCSSFIISKQDGLSPSVELLICVGDYFEFSIDYLVGVKIKESTSSKIEEVVIEVLDEFDGAISSIFIDDDKDILGI